MRGVLEREVNKATQFRDILLLSPRTLGFILLLGVSLVVPAKLD